MHRHGIVESDASFTGFGMRANTPGNRALESPKLPYYYRGNALKGACEVGLTSGVPGYQI